MRNKRRNNENMEENYQENFRPMPIADLLNGECQYHFVIPSFQRGYRWEKKQVTDLLDDIWQFAKGGGIGGDSYFLQPIVVKATKYEGKDAWEVLDGQQRLTTLLLILKELMKRMDPEEKEDFKGHLYDIKYTNRPQLNFDKPEAANNIDSYYLSEAIATIKEWCKGKKGFYPLISCLFYSESDLEADKKRQVKIIWYAIDEYSKDLMSIRVFNRLNKGKISLTSSELIKALFIMDYDERKEKAMQLSMEWNEIEKKFQDDSFWYFISNDSDDVQTRIDVLFDFVTERGQNTDSDYSYREFQKLYDFCHKEKDKQGTFTGSWGENIQDMEDAWQEVRRVFDRLVAWYEDNLYYHHVGFLVANGAAPLEVFNYLEEEKAQWEKAEPEHEWTVEDTENALRRRIMELFKRNKSAYISKDEIDELDYEREKEHIKRLLLLFNVEFCKRGGSTRFAFDKFKKENWDIEHVDSQNDATLGSYEDRMRWLKNVKFILERENTKPSNELAGKCEEMITVFTKNKRVNESQYKAFYHEVIEHYSHGSGGTGKDENKNLVNNLTLLDSATNRAYKDAPFAYKRYYIIEQDKKGNRFYPPCTRNLFLKYYTNCDKEPSYLDTMRWSGPDRDCYLRALHEVVDKIFDSVN